MKSLSLIVNRKHNTVDELHALYRYLSYCRMTTAYAIKGKSSAQELMMEQLFVPEVLA